MKKLIDLVVGEMLEDTTGKNEHIIGMEYSKRIADYKSQNINIIYYKKGNVYYIKDKKREECKKEISDKAKVCPHCRHKIAGYPAISREDNKTKICSECGIKEALEKFNKERRKR